MTAGEFAQQLQDFVYPLELIPTRSDLYITCISRAQGGARGNSLGNCSRGQSGCTLQVPRHQMARSWEFPAITHFPWHPLASSRDSIPSILSGRMLARGKFFPRLSPLPGDHPGVLPLVFHSYVLFTLYNHYFIGRFEKRVKKISKIKYI